MKKKVTVVLTISLIISFLIAPYSSVSVQAAPTTQNGSGSPSSDKAPAGYKPISQARQARSTAIGNADILLVQTALPWRSDANTQVLDALGYTYDVVDMSNIAQVDLFRYPVVLIVNDQVQSFYDQYANQVSAFEAYVNQGGMLVFFAASDGWAEGTLSTDLPGGVKITTPWYEYNNYIVDPHHPIITGQLSDGNALTDSDLFSYYCSHGYFSALPPNTDIILRESHGYPTLVEYKLGQGTVIASTLTWEHDWSQHTGGDQYGTFARNALDDLFLYAFSKGNVVDGILHVFPASVPADGATSAQVTLTGVPGNHRVRLISSRGSIDTFDNATGTTDPSGRFVTRIRSVTVGTTVLTAQDLNTGQTFPATISINFTGNDQTTPSPDIGEIRIAEVKGGCGQIDCPVDGFFMLGLNGLYLPLEVKVDWRGNTPGSVNFSINGYEDVVPADAQKNTPYRLNVNERLHVGSNVLNIVAHSGDKSSKVFSLNLFGYQPPQWVMDGVNTLPSIGNQTLVLEIAFPGQPLCKHKQGRSKQECEDFQFGFLPGDLNHFEWQTNIKLTLPTRGGAFEIEISRERDQAATGRKPKALLKLIGHEFDLQYGGHLQGVLGPNSPYIVVQELGINGSISTELSKDVGIPDALNALPPFGPIAYQALNVVPSIRDWLNDRAKLYAKITPELSGTFALAFQPNFHVSNAQIGLDFPVEIGAQADLWVVEGHIYGGLAGKGTIGYSAEDLRIASAQARGFGGYKFRLTWYSIEDEGEWMLAEYPPGAGKLTSSFKSSLNQPAQWQFVAHNVTPFYTVFRAESNTHQAFTLSSTNLSAFRSATNLAQTTNTSVLVSNVYTYAEPSLAVNATNNALLLWTHDDVNKPVGQAHEIEFSRWNGSTWSTPAGVTNDNLLDGAPQVAWTGNGKSIAVWQRLNKVLPPNAPLDATTTKQIEIATSTYAPNVNTWSPVTLLTTNSALDMTPSLARNSNGDLLAVWRQNSAGLLGGDMANPDRIMTAFYTNGWSTPQVAVDNIPGLVDLAVGYGNSTATLAFTRYLAPTGGITPTLQLFTSTWNGVNWSAPTQLTDDGLGHTNPRVIYNTANQPLLVWLVGHELRLRNLANNNILALTLPTSLGNVDEFRTVQDASGNVAAVFTAQSSQRDLFVSFYDQAHNLWGKPTQLTQDRASESYPAPALDTNGQLLLAYAATAINSVVKTTTDPTTGQNITFTVPTEGQTNLLTLSHEFGRNLTLTNSGFQVSNHYPQPGDSITLMATLTNTGDLALDNVTVAFYDGNPTSGGLLIGASSLAAPLAAGFTTTLTTTYVVPATGGGHQLYAIVDPSNATQETDETDNQASLAVFGPDLAMNALAVKYWGSDNVDLVSQISNIGTTASPTTTIAFYQNTLNGTAVLIDTVPPIAAGSQFTLTTPWNYGNLAPGAYPLLALVNPLGATAFAETNLVNNRATTTLNVGPDLMVSSYYLQTGSLTGATAVFTATLYNIGAAPANNTKVNFYRRGDLATHSLVFSSNIPILEPGKTAVLNGQVAGPLGCGLYVQADPDQGINEVSKANNLAYAPAIGGRCASFYNTPATAIAPTSIIFTDTSTGNNTAWLWNFGDGTTSTERNSIHQYNARGAYTVTITVSGVDGVDSYALPNAVRIYQQVQANFDASLRSGPAPLQVAFMDHSTGDISSWVWDFGDGESSIIQNPVHTYAKAGIYPVTLTVTGLGGKNTQVRSGYITVSEPPTSTPTSTPTPTATFPPILETTPTPTATATPIRTPIPNSSMDIYLPVIHR